MRNKYDRVSRTYKAEHSRLPTVEREKCLRDIYDLYVFKAVNNTNRDRTKFPQLYKNTGDYRGLTKSMKNKSVHPSNITIEEMREWICGKIKVEFDASPFR